MNKISVCAPAMMVLALIVLACASSGHAQTDIYSGQIIWSEDFEAGWGDWWSDFGIWDVGVPSSGPNAAYGGDQCAGTVLDGNYSYGPDSRLIGPQIQLPPIEVGEELVLRFRQWWSYQSADRGYVQVQAYDETVGEWSNWTTLKEVYSFDATWHHARVDLSDCGGQWIRLGFYHVDGTERDGYGNNHHVESSGWYIDEAEIVRQPIPEMSGMQDFESGWDGWWCDRGVWEVGIPTSGPGSGYNSDQCAATVLAGNYPYGPDSRFVSPHIQLPEATDGEEVLLRFRQRWSYQSADRGYVQIQVCDDVNGVWSDWTTLEEVYSYDSTWHHARVDLTAYAGMSARLGFYHTDGIERDGYGNNHHVESLGWYVDDVELVKQATPLFCGFEGFDLGWGGWWCDCGIWEVGAPSTGPGESYSGTGCAATKLSSDYPYGPDSILVSPTIQLPPVTAPGEILLRFRQWWSYSSSDKGQVKIRTYDEGVGDWSAWESLYEVTAHGTTSWHHARVPITAYAGQRVQVGFHHQDNIERDGYGNNHHAESSGWYIDEVEILPSPLCSTVLTIASTEGGTVLVPGEGEFPCAYGEVVCLEVQAEDGYRFVCWEGTAIDAGSVLSSETDPEACVTVDGNYTLTAVFEPTHIVVYDLPLDSNPGWALEGQWAFGVPTGQRCSGWGNVDPTGGHTGANVAGVNLGGCYDLVLGGPYAATAGPFDLSDYADVTLRFRRWLNCDIPEYVRCTIDISTDGQTWNTIWTPGEREEITDAVWTECEYRLTQADLQPTVYVRWTYEVVRERAYAYTGWNLDDVQIIGTPQ